MRAPLSSEVPVVLLNQPSNRDHERGRERIQMRQESSYLSKRNLTTCRLKFNGTVLLNHRLKPINRPIAVNIFWRRLCGKNIKMISFMTSSYYRKQESYEFLKKKHTHTHTKEESSCLIRGVNCTAQRLLSQVDICLELKALAKFCNFS